MKLGLSSALEHRSAEEWAEKMWKLGCKAVVFPVDYTAKDSVISSYVDAAHRYDLVIAEVGIWKNVFAVDAVEREKARCTAVGQLRLADAIGAKCCVNVAGTYGGPVWDGGYRSNFTKECWDLTIEYTQKLIDEVKPTRTKYSIEPMPWMYPKSPDECVKMWQAVDRESFGVHLDVVNMINCPERYFFMNDFLQECFDKVGSLVCSCHLKDIRLRDDLTFQLEETFCGNGALDIIAYISLINQCDPNMPVIIEHLNTDEEYISSLRYVQECLRHGGLL